MTGTITFTQNAPVGPVTVSGELKGLDPDELRGFHVQYVNPAASNFPPRVNAHASIAHYANASVLSGT